jgi:hypothetical protein
MKSHRMPLQGTDDVSNRVYASVVAARRALVAGDEQGEALPGTQPGAEEVARLADCARRAHGNYPESMTSEEADAYTQGVEDALRHALGHDGGQAPAGLAWIRSFADDETVPVGDTVPVAGLAEADRATIAVAVADLEEVLRCARNGSGDWLGSLEGVVGDLTTLAER